MNLKVKWFGRIVQIGVGISDGLGEGLFILVMLLAGFIVLILLVVTPFVVVFLLVAILKFNARMCIKI